LASALRDSIFKGLDLVAEESEGAYGHFPDQRPVPDLLDFCIIPLDKPAGQTSSQVVAWVRQMLGATRAGHSGTLDPPATGLLPIALGDATKALSTLLLGPKQYYAVMRLHNPVGEFELKSVLSEFQGDIYQKPPERSSVRRERRVRSIYELEQIERNGNLVLLRVLCQAGTYVRKLIYDMGEVLGVGASMIELRRTKVSDLTEARGMVRLHDLYLASSLYKEKGDDSLLRQCVWPIEAALTHMKALAVKDSAVDALCHGATLTVPGVARASRGLSRGDPVAIYTQKGELVALANSKMSFDEVYESERGVACVVERVVMPSGTYPKGWKTSPPSAAQVAP
jgi:H/ACA ribonucleoprotein complex subunit 4